MVYAEPGRRAVSVIFEKLHFPFSLHLFCSRLKQTSLFFQMCLTRRNRADLCPNTIHFDMVDFGECHSEKEIISFDAQCKSTTESGHVCIATFTLKAPLCITYVIQVMHHLHAEYA